MAVSSSSMEAAIRSRPFPDLPVNPFDDNVVGDSRKMEAPTIGVNDAILLELMQRFGRLENGPIPRDPTVPQPATLVLSPEGGYGKTHLIGRLFAGLRGRANLIQLRPFEDVHRPWGELLVQTVQEMGKADRFGRNDAKLPSQIEVWSLGVLTHLAADYLAETQAEAARQIVSALRRSPLEAVAGIVNDPYWRDWLIQMCGTYSSKLAERLEYRRIDLNGREEVWIQILFALSFGAEMRERRRAALKWLRGEWLDEIEQGLLRLKDADNDMHPGQSQKGLEQRCRERLLGLCKLSGFYRPFIFSVDRTELLELDTPLILNFGRVLERLFAEFPHQFTLLTVNEVYWHNTLGPNMLSLCRSRIHPPLWLEGVNREEGCLLLKSRLDMWELDMEIQMAFIDPIWMESIFGHRDFIPPRELLEAAAVRWRNQGGKTTIQPATNLEELFQSYLNDVRENPQLLQFNHDALMWFVRSLGRQVEARLIREGQVAPDAMSHLE